MSLGSFYGLPTRVIHSKTLRLEYLAETGPRIVRLCLANTHTNLLAEVPDLHWDTPYGKYSILGGHRLWHAPEAFPRTYIPDGSGLQVVESNGSLRLQGQPEPGSGMRKSIEIGLDAELPTVRLNHCLENTGLWPVQLAPWAITQLPLGGTAILPQTEVKEDQAALLPNRQIVLWPYTRLSDSRLELYDDLILIQASGAMPPVKIGHLNQAGWLAYWNKEVLFVKRFEPQSEHAHPDFNCNAECYCGDRFIEIETLGPLGTLEPGKWTSHLERWEVYPAPGKLHTIEAVRRLLNELGLTSS